MRSKFWCVAALAALMAGCGSESGTPTNTADAAVTTCTRAFEATVTAGPDMGTKLVGRLTLNRTSATTVTGQVVPVVDADAGAPLEGQINQTVPVTGVIAGNQLTLTFMLPGGRTMTGTGTLPASGICPARGEQLTGGLTGPAAGDTGDWLLSASVTVCGTVFGSRVCVTVSVDL
jgi:hypothetical protein